MAENVSNLLRQVERQRITSLKMSPHTAKINISLITVRETLQWNLLVLGLNDLWSCGRHINADHLSLTSGLFVSTVLTFFKYVCILSAFSWFFFGWWKSVYSLTHKKNPKNLQNPNLSLLTRFFKNHISLNSSLILLKFHGQIGGGALYGVKTFHLGLDHNGRQDQSGNLKWTIPLTKYDEKENWFQFTSS